MYYPFRQWFLSRLINFEFPIWNPYWGAGHEALIWSTVPIDPYTIIELIIGPRYAYFHLIQCMAIVMACYYALRKLKFEAWTAATGSLLFFMSPIVTYWYFHFIKTDLFIAHMLIFIFMVSGLKAAVPPSVSYELVFIFRNVWNQNRILVFEIVFSILLSIIIFVMKPKRLSMVFMAWAGILMAILAQAWQMNLLVNALRNSGRLAIPMGFIIFLFRII